MIDNEYFTEVDIPMDENVVAMFQAGEVAMIPLGTWFQQMFIAADMVPGEDYDAFIMPNVNPDLGRNQRLAPQQVAGGGVERAWPVASSLWSKLVASVSVDNLMDSAVYDQCGLPQAGRTLRFGLALR